MDKESIYLFQKLNCNCNDCIFMNRDFDALKEAKKIAEMGEKYLFDRTFKRRMQEAWDNNKAGKHKRCSNLIKDIRKKKFVYVHTSDILYGNCTKLKKKVTFIANDFQLETQECFKHRKDNI